MTNVSSTIDIARGFASEFGVNLDADMQQLGVLVPHLVKLDKVNGPLAHITDDNGADYYAAQITFENAEQNPAASRAIAAVMPGYRTNFAYWPKKAHPKDLSVHRGHGYFIVANPESDDLDGEFTTEIYPVDAEVTPSIRLQPGRFYTFEAASWSHEPLVVSGLSQTDADGHWEQAEILVQPGDEVLNAPEGLVVVPEEFSTGDLH